jgi:hypothetical protein
MTGDSEAFLSRLGINIAGEEERQPVQRAEYLLRESVTA